MTNVDFKTLSETFKSVFELSLTKALIAIMAYFFGYIFKTKENFIGLFTPILILFAIDTITGFYCAIKLKEIDSQRYSRIMAKAFSFSIYIITGLVMDKEFGQIKIMGIGLPADSFAMGFKAMIISSESLSIFENLAKLGFPIPEYIRKYLKAFTDNGKEIKK